MDGGSQRFFFLDVLRLRVSNLNYAGNIDKEYNKSSFARLMNGEFVSILPLRFPATRFRRH